MPKFSFAALVALLPIYFSLQAAAKLTYPGNVTIYQKDVPFVPGSLPKPFAASKGEEIVELFSNLGRSTVWNLTKTVDFGFFHEPEGMIRVGKDRYFVSDNEYFEKTVKYPQIINGTDRTPGVGFGYLTIVDGSGKLVARQTLNELGALEYHNGGIEYDGQYIWATLAQYRPNSTATLLKIDPETLSYDKVLHLHDHFGAVVHDTKTKDLAFLNWGSRNASYWNSRKKGKKYPEFTKPLKTVRNPSFFIDYQDAKFLGHIKRFDNRPMMFASGLATIGNVTIGGLAIVDMQTMVPVMEVPFNLKSDRGFQITQNPVDVDVVDGKLQVYFLPDQEGEATLYVYEAQPESPFQFGGGPQQKVLSKK